MLLLVNFVLSSRVTTTFFLDLFLLKDQMKDHITTVQILNTSGLFMSCQTVTTHLR